jgi:4-hydroxy-L-threonine phosphate dehydrogenase PdxA
LAVAISVIGDMQTTADAHDLYIAMYHDQGHIPVKVAAPLRSSAITVGTPVVFGTVAHGSAYDIAGQNRADPSAFANAFDLTISQFGGDSARNTLLR